MKTKIFVIAAIAVAVVALGLTGFSYVSAQTQDVPLDQAFQQGSPPLFHPRGPGGDKGAGPLSPYTEAAAAGILGLSVEDLQAAKADGTPLAELLDAAGLTVEEFRAAMDAATPDIVAQALEDGVITQEQADFILENGLRGPKGAPGPRLDGALHPYIEAATADILGLSVEDLQAAREDGTRMSELLDTAGLTVDEFRTAMEAATPDIVAQALEDGAVTQEQADFILENGLRGPGGHGPGGCNGSGRRGPGGHGPGGFGPQGPPIDAPTGDA